MSKLSDILNKPYEQDNQVLPKSTAKYSTTDYKEFQGVNCNVDALDPAIYRCSIDYHGTISYNKVDKNTTEMLQFPSAQQSEVIEEIKEFWDKSKDYKQFGIAYKRGLLLYGPHGSGKTSVINILIKDIIERNGVVIDFKSAKIDIPCIQFFRKAEPTRPLMIVMEDLDSLFIDDGSNQESAILNLLDGIYQVENVVFLATTNYPEKLEARITDRPSRFDRVTQVGLPEEKDREFYLKHLLSKMNGMLDIDLKKWVKETSDLSIAHLKELVISVTLYNKSYEESLKKLGGMKKPLTNKGSKKEAGFKV